jgi:hypothetical protein
LAIASTIDILLPARLIIRAADDLHRLVDIADRALAQLETLEERTDRMVSLGERIEGQAVQLIDLGTTVSGQATQIIDIGGRVSGQADQLNDLGTRMETLGREVLDQGVLIEQRAVQVANRAGELVEALPTIEQAVTMVSPLEGAVERFGRAVDRLPGGRPRLGGRGGAEDEARHEETQG